MKSAFLPADILLPGAGTDMTKWSVVACDQYTSEPEYWQETERLVGDNPSTLRLILPEIYLSCDDTDKRIAEINKTMTDYLDGGMFEEYKDTFVYVRRKQADGRVREGLVGKIDLEQYDYHKGSNSAVRATEATVTERIPPRIKVRKAAKVELPHIMILIDDAEGNVIEPLGRKTAEMQKLYDFELMQKGGHIEGYLVNKAESDRVIAECDKLYNCDSPLVFAMGDGNHSLATAKEWYEQLKKAHPGEDLSNHPARYALVEIVNLHSPALQFEAIHRIVTGVNVSDFISDMEKELGVCYGGDQSFDIIVGDSEKRVTVGNPTSNLTVGSLQNFIDGYIAENGGSVDYIHGADTVRMLAKKPNSVGFILPDMAKQELFPTVMKDGALPRKTFSMGHANDKRYYVESRKIV